jgi:hypothetical protein
MKMASNLLKIELWKSIYSAACLRSSYLPNSGFAAHVLNLHMHAQRAEAGNADISSSSEEISLDLMRKYVCYSKMKIRPTLSEEAQHML